MNIRVHSYIFSIFLFFSVSNYADLADNQMIDLSETWILSTNEDNEQKILINDFRDIDTDLKPEELMLYYQHDIAYCKDHYPDVCTKQLEKVVEYYQHSLPVSLVDEKIAQLFHATIKDFLHNLQVEYPNWGINSRFIEFFELRVLPVSVYQGKDTILFFNMSNVGVFYILDEKLALNLDIIQKDMIRQFNLCKEYLLNIDNRLMHQFLSKCDLPCSIDTQFIGLLKETVEFKKFKFFEQNSEEFEKIFKKHAQREELKFHSPSFKNNDFFDSEKIISEYELLNKYSDFLRYSYFKNNYYNLIRLINSVEYYRKSKSISEVNAKVSQAFEIIKMDLGIEEPVQLRVIPDFVYEEINEKKVLGFFDSYCPGVVYITEEQLQQHPILIIATIVHELEHYRQFWCYPGSFEWTKENQELLGMEEFNRQLEYGADKRAAEYFKSFVSSFLFTVSRGYFLKNPQGYFSVIDAAPYVFKNYFLAAKGDFKGESFDIVNHLPSSGIYWHTDHICWMGLIAVFAALNSYNNYKLSLSVIK